MKLRVLAGLLFVLSWQGAMVAQEHQPPGAAEAFEGLTSEHATHTAVTFDRDMIQTVGGIFNQDGGPVAGLDSITVENFRFHEPAFYIPENMHALIRSYKEAGWTHLVEQTSNPRESASPTKQIADVWLHFRDMNIDGVTVLVRGPRQMSVVEVHGILKPLDLVHLSGHFGIPKVDPGAVMVPEHR